MSNKLPGTKKPTLKQLPRITDRITFMYLEHAKIHRQDSAIQIISDIHGTATIPSAMINVLLLGPGIDITHQAIELIGNTGTNILWVGEYGVKMYAHGSPLTAHNKYIVQQAKLVSNPQTKTQVARKMYQMRFPDMDVQQKYIKELRGYEGQRMKKIYQKEADRTSVPWHKRLYQVEDYDLSDPPNKAITTGNQALYGLTLSIILALGASPALGFIHQGTAFCFVYDLSDLYKAKFIIPLAFDIVQKYGNDPNLSSLMRQAVRDKFKNGKLAKQMTLDLTTLLNLDQKILNMPEISMLQLWDDREGLQQAGVQYR